MSRRMTLVAPLLALAFSTATLMAQNGAVPTCEHLNYRGNFRLNGAKQHMDMANSGTVDRESQLKRARSLLDQANRSGGVDRATLWYLYGTLYSMEHDLVGADSAWSKAEAGTDSSCRVMIERLRYNEWVPLENAAVEQMNAGNMDSALALFRTGNTIFRAGPHAFMNMASIFVGRNETDSAIRYFRLAARSSEDPRYADVRETALFNAARLLQREAVDSAGIHAEAQRRSVTDSVVRDERLRATEAAYRDVLQLKPRDLAAQASLAGILTALHRESAAEMVYDSMLAHSDSMASFDLFDAGVALFRSGRYGLAARFINSGLTRNSCNRDALYNLANVYLAARDTAKLMDAARRLEAVDPMSRNVLAVLARAYQDNGEKDSTLKALLRADSLQWEIRSISFEPGDTTATLHAMVTNLRPETLKGFTLTIDFVNGACESVATQTVDLPDLSAAGSPGQAYDFTLTASGRGIVAWKYSTN
jgi:tetratricopeptide (TPR) repeat protein